MNGLLVASSASVIAMAVVVTLALPLRGSIERLVAAFLLCQAGITVALLVCGVVLHRLDGPTIAAFAILELVVSLLALRGSRLRSLGAAGRQWLADGRAGAYEAVRNPAVVLLGIAVLAVLAWRLVLALRLPVLDYDGFSYHLVTVDVWLQGDAIGRVPQRIWSDSYPANGELLTLWLMAFTRNDGLASLTGLLPIPLAAVATVGMARILGAARDWALLAGLVLIATPAVIVIAGTSYVDTLTVADLAATWMLGLSAVRAETGRRRTALLLLTGIAIGLGVGTKASNIGPSVVLVAVVLAEAARRRRPAGRSAIAWLADLAMVAAPAVLLGGYWYVKDFIVFGNPVWPFTIGPLRGLGTFAQLIVQTPAKLVGLDPIRQILASWVGDLSVRTYPFDTRVGGFGLQWLIVVALAIGGVALLARQRSLLPILAVFLPAAATLLLMPMGWWPRLTLFVVVAAIAAAALVLSRLDRRAGLALGIAIAVLSTVSLGVATATANTTARATGSGSVPLISLARIVRADAATRANLGLWAQCRGFDQMPAGSVVATDGFNLLHLVVGHDLSRRLATPIVQTADPVTLLSEARAVGASHLAILTAGKSAVAVRADPTTFRSLGPVCRGVELVALPAA